MPNISDRLTTWKILQVIFPSSRVTDNSITHVMGDEELAFARQWTRQVPINLWNWSQGKLWMKSRTIEISEQMQIIPDVDWGTWVETKRLLTSVGVDITQYDCLFSYISTVTVPGAAYSGITFGPLDENGANWTTNLIPGTPVTDPTTYHVAEHEFQHMQMGWFSANPAFDAYAWEVDNWADYRRGDGVTEYTGDGYPAVYLNPVYLGDGMTHYAQKKADDSIVGTTDAMWASDSPTRTYYGSL